MTGLRERKKQEVRLRIIRAAESLFASKGLDNTTMEDVASAADVSVATVYNYFGSKSALLLAAVAEETSHMVEAGSVILEDPGSHIVPSIQRLVRVYVDEFSTWDKRLLREVLSAAFQSGGDAALTEELVQLDQRLIEQMMALIAHFHQEDQLADDVDVYEATLLVFSVFVLQLFMFMSLEEFTTKDLYEQVERQIALVFTGIEKANSK